jgi:hypothetical protein
MREIIRYQLQNHVEKSFDFERGVKPFELNSLSGSTTHSHKAEVRFYIFFSPISFNADCQ